MNSRPTYGKINEILNMIVWKCVDDIREWKVLSVDDITYLKRMKENGYITDTYADEVKKEGEWMNWSRFATVYKLWREWKLFSLKYNDHLWFNKIEYFAKDYPFLIPLLTWFIWGVLSSVLINYILYHY